MCCPLCRVVPQLPADWDDDSDLDANDVNEETAAAAATTPTTAAATTTPTTTATAAAAATATTTKWTIDFNDLLSTILFVLLIFVAGVVIYTYPMKGMSGSDKFQLIGQHYLSGDMTIKDNSISFAFFPAEAESCASLSMVLKVNDIEQRIKRDFCHNTCWSVNRAVDEQLSEIQAVGAPNVTQSELITLLHDSLKGMNAETRIAAINTIEGYIDVCKKRVSTHQAMAVTELPCAKEPVINNTIAHPALSFVSLVRGISLVLGTELVFDYSHLNELKEKIDAVAMENFFDPDFLNEITTGTEVTRGLQAAIVKLSEDPTWRISLAFCEFLIIPSHGRIELILLPYNETEIIGLDFYTLKWTFNQILCIREAAFSRVKKLIKKFGTQWEREIFRQHVIQLTTAKNDFHRLASLFTIRLLYSEYEKHVADRLLLPSIIRLATDECLLVRLNVAKTLQIINSTNDPEMSEQVKQSLYKLRQDHELIRYHANQAIKFWNLTTSS